MAQYHLFKNGQQAGPFSQELIDQMLKSGLITGVELYLEEGETKWKPVSQLPGFVAPPAVQAPRKMSGCLVAFLVTAGIGVVLVPVIALLAAIAVPNFLRARKRSQATRVLQDLRLIDSAIDQYAVMNNKERGFQIGWTDIQIYLPLGSQLANSGGRDILGHPFGPVFITDSLPNVPAATFQSLSDVAPAEFWSPFKAE